jgi:tetratricopeptide (TPR) repeat protein
MGPSCEREKTFPFLAVYHEGALAGDVKLDVGCSSPGLEGKRLNIVVATAEDRLMISQDGDNSATSIAAKNSNKKELEKLARESLIAGQLKMKEENWAAARTALERSITYDDGDWKAWSYLSQVELKLSNVAKGLECINKALLAAITAKPPPTHQEQSELFYNKACAQARNGQKRDAITTLKKAFMVGDAPLLAASAVQDPDLEALRDEADFKRVIADAKAKKDKRGTR